MNISKVKALLKDPILFFALFTMIASTLISLLLLKNNDSKIEMLKSEARNKQTKIRELSDDINQKYSNVSTLIILDFIAGENNKKAELIKKRYFDILLNVNSESSLLEVLETFEKERINDFEIIDNLYIEQISLEMMQYKLEKKNKIYSAMATLFQVVGLALIIIRKDLSTDDLF